jgi:putative ABC transport system permease protein
MPRLLHDLRYSARALIKAPVFTTVAVVSLGLALALNTTMFALADAVLHPYVPYPEPERIVIPAFRGGDPKHALTFERRFQAVRDRLHAYDRVASFSLWRGALVQAPNSEEYRTAALVSPEFFDVLGVHPMLGRVFALSEGSQATQAAVISYRLWNRLFRDRSLSEGISIDVARSRYTIIGVMPRAVHYPYEITDIWLPADAPLLDPSVHPLGPIAVMHLRDGVTIDAFRAELMSLAASLTSEYSPKRPLSASVIPLAIGFGSQGMFPSFVLYTVAMVLIIACANLATMLIARGMARRRDTAVRVALGATRRDVIRATLCECALIVGTGVTLGTLLTWWALYILPHYTIPFLRDLGDLLPMPSWRVFGFAVVVAMLTVIVAGLMPALRAAAVDPAEPMKDGAGSSTGRVRDRYNLLIVVEVALSTALLMCSGLFVVGVVRLAAFNFQYAAKELATTKDIQLSGKHLDATAVNRTYQDITSRTAMIAHVRAVATQHANSPEGRVVFAENGRAGARWINSSSYLVVSPDYFRALGIDVVRGRDFMPGDARGPAPVVIVDERAAERLWPDITDPVGHMVKLGAQSSSAPWLRVVGVVRSIDYMPRRDFDLPPEPLIHVVMPDDDVQARTLFVRGDGGGGDRGRAALALAVQREIEALVPSLHHVMALLFGSFAGFGLLLCGVGLYGVLAYTVSRRLREFAVRIALGARRRDVMRIVIHDAAVMALAGVGIGAFVALRVAHPIIVDMLGATPYAPAIALVAGELVLFTVTFIVALAPLRQAASADPVEVLRAT